MSWKPPPDPAPAPAAYELYRDDALVATQPAPSFNDSKLASWTRYCYAVRALDGAGLASPLTAPVCAKTLDGDAPTAPAGLAVASAAGNRASLTWSASKDNVGVAGYDVVRDGERLELVQKLAFIDHDLATLKKYCYTVRAFDQAGNRSPPPEPVCLTIPDTTPPSAPEGVTARGAGETEVALAWTASTDDVAVTRYEVQREGREAPRVVDGAAAREDGLKVATRYCFRVRACDASGNCSTPSAEACAVTPDLTAPSRPASLAGEATGDREVALTWAPSSDNVAVAGYEVFRGGEKLAGIGPVTTFRDGGLEPWREYCYTVRALDAAGNASAPSAKGCVKTPDHTPPSVPEAPAAVPVSSVQLFVSWDPSTDDVGVTGYEVLRGGKVLATVTATRHRDLKLQPEQRYCYAVRALDAAGNRSEPTPEFCGKTTSPAEMSAPSDLRARRLSPTSVQLQWEPSDAPGVLYQVYAQDKVIGTTGSNTFTPSGRLGAESNCYRVNAFDPDGRQSPKSNEVCARTAAARPP